MSVSYRHSRPAVTVDCVVLRRIGSRFELLLIQRKAAPFAGRWALPGGFVGMAESLEAAAHRELREETGLRGIPLTQFQAFGDPGRDPRGRTISIVYRGRLTRLRPSMRADDDAAGLAWFPLDRLPPLAFDHRKIVELARKERGIATVKRNGDRKKTEPKYSLRKKRLFQVRNASRSNP